MNSQHAGQAPVVLASNRGPISYALGDDGALTARRGGGGLVAALSGAGEAVWVCAALTDGDRMAARAADHGRIQPGDDLGAVVRMLALDPGTFTRAYSSIANSTLWFVHHLLFNSPFEPVVRGPVRARLGVVRRLQRRLRRGAGRGGGTGGPGHHPGLPPHAGPEDAA